MRSSWTRGPMLCQPCLVRSTSCCRSDTFTVHHTTHSLTGWWKDLRALWRSLSAGLGRVSAISRACVPRGSPSLYRVLPFPSSLQQESKRSGRHPERSVRCSCQSVKNVHWLLAFEANSKKMRKSRRKGPQLCLELLSNWPTPYTIKWITN